MLSYAAPSAAQRGAEPKMETVLSCRSKKGKGRLGEAIETIVQPPKRRDGMNLKNAIRKV
jgi:hypothetical protein